MINKYYIGVDAGTSIIKSVIFNEILQEYSRFEVEVSIESPHAGWAEIDMIEVWEAVKKSIRNVIKESEVDAKLIKFIAVTGQGSGCWMIDHNGNPSRKAILWNDGRAHKIIDEWNKNKITEEAYSICNSVQIAGLQGPIVNWIKQNEPQILKKTRCIFYCRDWIRYKLTNEICTDSSDVSQTLLDIRKIEYSNRLFEIYNIAEYKKLFPKIFPDIAIISKMKPNIAKEIGLITPVPVITSPVDVRSCGIGVGAIKKGQAYTILGTTCANNILIGEENLNSNINVGMTYYFGIRGLWNKALCSMLGTPNIEWFIKEFCSDDKIEADKKGIRIYQLLDSRITNIGPSYIIYHPFLSPSGERAPFVSKSAKAMFFGLNTEHSKYHLFKAIYEGIAFSIKDCYESVPVPIKEIIISGGGSKSDIWLQIIADITGKIVKITEGKELGAKGAVLCSLVTTGCFKNLDEAVKKTINVTKVFKPNPSSSKVYNEIFKLYKKLYKEFRNDWDYLYYLEMKKVIK